MIIKKILNPIRLLAKHIFFLVLGSSFFLFIITFLLVGWPIFVYRWIVTKVLAPAHFRRQGDTMAKAVNSAANMVAAEFLQPDMFVPRCTTIINLTVDGYMGFDEFYHLLDEKWIKFKLEKETTLRYPELQQYPAPWMGFMFWRTDPHFDLKHHIVVHTLDENKSDVEVDKFKCQLIEQLVNKPYVPKRSPWEMHLVQYYRQPVSTSDSTEKSSAGFNVILRIHHALADGYALMHLLLEQLSGHNLEKTLLAIPNTEKEKSRVCRDVLQSVTFPVRVIHELGHVLSWAFKGWGPLHVRDGRKSWLQMYARMKPIPISKLKYIKSAFGVGFISVLNSVLAAALGRMLKKLDERGKRNKVKNLLFGIAVPRANHPKKMRIHVLGVAFDVPVTLKMDPIDRLYKCEDHVIQIKKTPMVHLALAGLKVFSSTPTRFARFMVWNRIIATGVTSFPGPSFNVDYRGRKVIGMDFAAGAMPGVGGVGFMALSYVDKIQICATAENAVLEREELHELLGYVQEELDILYALAVNYNNNKDTSNLLGEENI